MERDLSRSRAVLISNASYRDPEVLDLPAVRGCVSAMKVLLTSDLCGWPADRISTLEDVATPDEFIRQLYAMVKHVDDVLLLYYAGHGMRTSNGKLALALRNSESDLRLRPHTTITYDVLADILRSCPAPTKLIILDCCHAELANRDNYQFQSTDIDVEHVDGLCFIGASKVMESAKSPLSGGLPYFTNALIDVVRTGIRGMPTQLSIDQIFTELRRKLEQADLPVPVESAIRDARHWPFARNAAPLETHVDLDEVIAALRAQKEDYSAEVDRLRRQLQASESANQDRIRAELAEATSQVEDVARAQAAAQAESRPAAESADEATTVRRPARYRNRRLHLIVGGVTLAVLGAASAVLVPVLGHNSGKASSDQGTSTSGPPAVSAPTLTPAGTFTDLTGNPLQGVTISSDGSELAAWDTNKASSAGNVFVWDSSTRASKGTFNNPDGSPPGAVAFTPDGKTLAVTDGTTAKIYLWDIASHSVTKTLTVPLNAEPMVPVAFSPDGNYLAVGDIFFGTTYINSLRTNHWSSPLTNPLGGHSEGMRTLMYSPDGKTLAGLDNAGTMQLWNTQNDQRIIDVTDPDSKTGIISLSFSPDGKTIALVEGDNNSRILRLWNVAGKKFVTTINHPGSWPEEVAYGAGGKALAVADSADKRIYLQNLTTSKTTAVVPHYQANGGHGLAFDSAGRNLATFTYSTGTAYLYKVGSASN